MEHRPLGNTGLTVAPVALGTGSIGEMFGPVTLQEAVNVVHAAIDLGVNLIDTSVYYGSAEERLGVALNGRREKVILSTKAGRYGFGEFDFSPARIRASLEQSLTRMKTDYVDIFQLHDVEFVPLGPVLGEGFATIQKLKDEGKCRFVGMSGYPIHTIERVMRETDVDVVLTYAKATLLDGSLADRIIPVAAEEGVGVINAAAVAVGLLTPGGTAFGNDHPASSAIINSALAMRTLAAERGVDISFIANQYSMWRSGASTTVIGTSKIKNLCSAITACSEPLVSELEAAFLALRPSPADRQWKSGLPENN
ncbi:aldo/keto reductase [Pseudarthrobacter sp. NPDC058329]|uniref:aldo/keto reductase n=1 Tax=Pseudarthrobacter sp. NPDC058329 TaxID=3346448 RepID=UPI0036DB9D42